MKFHLKTHINRPVEQVFAFLRDIDQHHLLDHPVVPVYAKVTPGPLRVGTEILEMVRVMPFICMEIRSQVTGLETNRSISYRWQGPGMHGELTYLFNETKSGMHLTQIQTLEMHGLGELFNPIVRKAFHQRIEARLADIKATLESKN